jgi:DNA repair protein RadD
MTTPLTLRPYQVADVARLRAQYANGAHRAVLYQLATGGGKTVVFANITQSAAALGRRVGVFTHRRELITQASAKLDLCGVPHGIMAAGMDRDHDAPVQVLSIQSAVNRTLPQFDFIVVDEAHHTVAPTWAELFAAQPKAKFLGVTATPARTDNKGLGVASGGLFDAMVCGPTPAELVALGYLAPTKFYVPARTIDGKGLRKIGGEYVAGEEMANRARVVTGDAIVEYREKCAGRSAIVFCVTVAHAEDVAAQFRAAGFRFHCVHGGTPKPERDALIAGLGDGTVDGLTSCDLISEGLDVPSVGCIIMLRLVGSLILFLQQVGRGMRPGKDYLAVLDHAANSDRHGEPEDPREWSLDGVKKLPKPKPVATGEGVGMGQKRDVETVAGVLVERAKGAAMRAKFARMSFRTFRGRKRSAVEIQLFAEARNYKFGWQLHYAREQAERFAVAAGDGGHSRATGWEAGRGEARLPAPLLTVRFPA